MRSRDAVTVTAKDTRDKSGGAIVNRRNGGDRGSCSARVLLPDKDLETESGYLFN